MKNIVACFDFSAATSEVIEMASALATALRTKLYLMHIVVAPPPLIDSEGGITPPLTIANAMHVAREKINELREPLFQHGLDVSTVLVEEHLSAVRAILEECERIEAGLIVMGSHGHGAVYRLLVGSTAEGVLRKARCPVLLVPSRAPAELESSPHVASKPQPAIA